MGRYEYVVDKELLEQIEADRGYLKVRDRLHSANIAYEKHALNMSRLADMKEKRGLSNEEIGIILNLELAQLTILSREALNARRALDRYIIYTNDKLDNKGENR